MPRIKINVKRPPPGEFQGQNKAGVGRIKIGDNVLFSIVTMDL